MMKPIVATHRGFHGVLITRTTAAATLLALFLLVAVPEADARGSREPTPPSVAPSADNAPAEETPEEASASEPPSSETQSDEPAPDEEATADPAVSVLPAPAPVYDGYPGTAGMPEPHFYPLGWSTDGAFAYLTLRGDPGRGGFSTRLFIINLVTDERLAEERELEWDHEPVADLLFPEDAPQILRYFTDLWRPQLEEASIDLDPDLGNQFARLPIARGDVSYFAQFDVVYGGEDEFLDNIEAYDFWLRGDNGTRKRVYSASPRALEVGASGYFMSPHEPRAAIVLIETRYTFEGNEPFAVVTGSNMAVGFEPVE